MKENDSVIESTNGYFCLPRVPGVFAEFKFTYAAAWSSQLTPPPRCHPLLHLSADGSLPKMPKYVYAALKKMGHSSFRKGQEEVNRAFNLEKLLRRAASDDSGFLRKFKVDPTEILPIGPSSSRSLQLSFSISLFRLSHEFFADCQLFSFCQPVPANRFVINCQRIFMQVGVKHKY